MRWAAPQNESLASVVDPPASAKEVYPTTGLTFVDREGWK